MRCFSSSCVPQNKGIMSYIQIFSNSFYSSLHKILECTYKARDVTRIIFTVSISSCSLGKYPIYSYRFPVTMNTRQCILEKGLVRLLLVREIFFSVNRSRIVSLKCEGKYTEKHGVYLFLSSLYGFWRYSCLSCTAYARQGRERE